ncbi:hypothetical protein GE09DRAFT_1282049 [Coniochaeta sp. 2T2.1]|nr:hypothetical protein GE09DRAFT_1282049 [Coniochaeta sp. 2T2.1]
MSSQENKGIPLSHAPNHVSYKLFELPPELLELLESDNPPVLTLTSSPTAALLKSPTKTYSLRQKNTSNALILLSPSSTTNNPSTSTPTTSTPNATTSTTTSDTAAHTSPIQDTGTDTGMSEMPDTYTAPGLNAIATVHETIELVPEGDDAAAPAKVAKGKWHERFAKRR